MLGLRQQPDTGDQAEVTVVGGAGGGATPANNNCTECPLL